MSLLDLGTFGLLPRSPYPSHSLYSIACLLVLPYHYQKHTTGQRLVFLIQQAAKYRHCDILLREHGTCIRRLERLSVVRQSENFRKRFTNGRKCKNALVKSDFDQKQWAFKQLFELLRRIL
jgi:hypothetical protein